MLQRVIFSILPVVFVFICFTACEERYADNGNKEDIVSDIAGKGDSGFEDAGSEIVFSPNLKYIDPFIGTGGYAPWGVGSNLPGATAPFGMIKVSPDIQSKKNYTFQNHCSGYFYTDEYIAGFSNVHFAGTGVPDYGNLRVLPLLFSDKISGKTEDYRLGYKKETEYAEVGYYSVELDSGIKAELTATQRVAFHRYSFPQDTNLKCILLDIGKTLPLSIVTESEMSISQKTGEIRAYAHQNGGLSINYGGYDIYFYGVIETVPNKVYGWEDDKTIEENKAKCKDGGMCGLLACYKDARTVNLVVAASYTSFDGAKVNFLSEGKNVDFEEARRLNNSLWNHIFRRVNIEGGSEENKRVFYSALYHIFMMPTLQNDADGSYRGFDKKNHRAE